MSPWGSETVLWRQTNLCFCAASQHLEHLSNCSIRFQSTPCVCKGIWESGLTCLWGRTDCQLIRSRCEETCEDAVWSVWLTFRTVALWRWNTWVFLFHLFLFPPILRCLIFHVDTKMMSPRDVMGRIGRRNFVWFCWFFLDNFRIDWTGLNKSFINLVSVLHQGRRVERHPLVTTC